ncbi:hypothetical protein M0802_009128 [Mischocyttarus mexicanus]|nr:hypothetical protein M0802_009128 [Mischocyttarus mexicanus]
MNPDRWVNICKNNKLYSRRPIGRSPKRWKYSIQSTTTEYTPMKTTMLGGRHMDHGRETLRVYQKRREPYYTVPLFYCRMAVQILWVSTTIVLKELPKETKLGEERRVGEYCNRNIVRVKVQ